MKFHALTCVALSLASPFFFSNSYANESDNRPDLVNAQFDKVYIPFGFDSNDNAQIVAEGKFPNSCYRPAAPLISVNHRAKTIFITPKAYRYSEMCIQIFVPFDRVIDLGILKKGNYSVFQKDAEKGVQSYLGEIQVSRSHTRSPDTYLYAPIEQAYFEQSGNQKTIHLSGEFTNSCMKIAQVLPVIQPEVLVIQPILEIEKRDDCETGSFPFNETLELPHLKAGRYLIHVRSMNGKAINSLINVR